LSCTFEDQRLIVHKLSPSQVILFNIQSMKIYQVDLRTGTANYANLTLFLFSKSDNKPTHYQIDTCLKLIEEEGLSILDIDNGLDITDYDFGIEQINSINKELIYSLKMDEVFYIIDAFDPSINIDNILNESGKIVVISGDGNLRYV